MVEDILERYLLKRYLDPNVICVCISEGGGGAECQNCQRLKELALKRERKGTQRLETLRVASSKATR